MNLSVLLQAPAAGASGFLSGGGGTILMMVAMFAIIYFFMIRPQMKKQKETKKYIESLKVNDKILTIGGIYGTVNKINEDGTIIMAIEDGSKMKISKNAISQDATTTLNQTT